MAHLSLQNLPSSSKVVGMRYGELAFLILMVAYHAALLVPRYRRAFVANYLVFLAGMALAWNLGLEGFRWQTFVPVTLILIDVTVLFPTFSSLRGRLPDKTFLSATGGVLRTLVASVAFLLSVASVALAVALPLPQVELTGGLSQTQRTVQFPAQGNSPGLELRVWYPSSGDLHPQPRSLSEPDAWRAMTQGGGLPEFWLAYLRYLPSSQIKGGATSSPGAQFPVVYVALPPDQSPEDFGYLFADLASRGLFVVAARPSPGAKSPQAPELTLETLAAPFTQTARWLEPDRSRAASKEPTDYRWLVGAKAALAQLDSEPGDPFYRAIDWTKQGLWAWGPGNSASEDLLGQMAVKGTVHFGGPPTSEAGAHGKELWVFGGQPGPKMAGRWYLSQPRLERADVSDSAYLRPYLLFFGLKSQADAGSHAALRQFQAAFFQYSFWGSAADTPFGQTVPQVPRLLLSGS